MLVGHVHALQEDNAGLSLQVRLGGNRLAVAKIAAYIGGCLQASVCIAVGGMIVMTADEWVEWFELDAESIALLYSTMPLAAAWWLAIAVGCGSLRNNLLGLGLVRFAAVVQLIATTRSGRCAAGLWASVTHR